jgi:hypothetical protein
MEMCSSDVPGGAEANQDKTQKLKKAKQMKIIYTVNNQKVQSIPIDIG